jgi:hypothetical protein
MLYRALQALWAPVILIGIPIVNGIEVIKQ